MSYSLGESYLSSPDLPSSVYPDRLIRPLPKRSLRSRLSEETAESISYPPTVPSTNLPSYTQYGENGEFMNDSKVLVQQNGDVFDHDHDHDHYHDDDHDHCPHHHSHHCPHDDDDDFDSEEDSSLVAVRRTSGYRSSPRSPRSARHTRYGSTNKTSSSAPDGYDAFENTNNKKKRKIPTSGSLSMHPSSLTADLAHMGLGNSKDGANDDGAGVGQYYGSGNAAVSAGLGVQGAGRGRNSRRVSGRNPLGVSLNGSNVRVAPNRYDGSGSTALKDEETKAEQGIISTAIANATALLRKPLGKGQENGGVLDQQPKTTPTNSQFTFTCESDSKGVTFPEQSLYAAGYPQRANQLPAHASSANQKFATQGTQTSPNMPSGHQNAQHPASAAQNAAPTNSQGKKPRRRRGDVYVLAARQRRLQQEYSNLHHPPAPEDVWICEFCEYESIFGVQPQALIRQYEIKDRKERRRLAEKRRLLEKAKMKGRKGKKQSKNAAAKAANNAAQQSANQQGYDQPLDQLGDEYLDDGYDDDPIPMPAPPQAPVKQPMPGSFDAGVGRGGTDRGGIR